MRRAILATLPALLMTGCLLESAVEAETRCLPRSCADVVAEATAQGIEPLCGLFPDGCGRELRCVAQDICPDGLTCDATLSKSNCARGGVLVACEDAPCGSVLPLTGETCLNNCLRWEPGPDPRAPNGPPLPTGRFAHLLVPILDDAGQPTSVLLVGGRTALDPSQPVSYFDSSEAWLLDVSLDGVTAAPLESETRPAAGAYWIGGGGKGEAVFGFAARDGLEDPTLYRYADAAFAAIGPTRDACLSTPGLCPLTSGAAAAYDPDARVLYLFGGDPWDDREVTDDLWSFAVEEGSWRRHARPAGASWPTGRFHASGVWQPQLRRFALFAGTTLGCFGAPDCVDRWSEGQLSCEGAPACRVLRDRPLAELWLFDPVTGRWEQARPDPGMAPRYVAGIAWDAAREAIVVMGGRGLSAGYDQSCAPPSPTYPETLMPGYYNLGDTWFWRSSGEVRDGQWRQLRFDTLAERDRPPAWSRCVDLALHPRLASGRDRSVVAIGGQLSSIFAEFEAPLVSRMQLLYGELP